MEDRTQDKVLTARKRQRTNEPFSPNRVDECELDERPENECRAAHEPNFAGFHVGNRRRLLRLNGQHDERKHGTRT